MIKNPNDMKQISHEERDFLLWRHFHKDLTPQELIMVQEELANNIKWQHAFAAIQADEQLLSSLETEMPSLRFSKNVMESIEQKAIAKPTSSYVNTKIVKFIGGGFIATIAAFLFYAISQVKWTAGTEGKGSPLQLPRISINWDFAAAGSWLYGCFAIVVVCVLVLVDKFLSNRRRHGTA